MPDRSQAGGLELDVSGRVATVTFNRPERNNGVTVDMVIEMHHLLGQLAGNSSVSVVVLTGSGKTFCPGADLAGGSSPRGELPDTSVYQSSTILYEMPQVTVAAINGGCAGAGLAWAAACDLRVASSSARFSTAFLELGLPGELGAPWTLQRALGGAVARDLCFLPRKIDAAEAMRIGLISQLFPEASFRSEASRLVDELASRDPSALRDLKRNFLDAERLPMSEYVEVEAARQLQRFVGQSRTATLERFAAQHAELVRVSQGAES